MASGQTLFVAASVSGLLAACSGAGDSTFDNGGADNDAGSGNANNSSGGLFEGDGNVNGGDGGGSTIQPLRIDPPVLVVTVGGSLVAPSGAGSFRAHLGTDPAPINAKWSVDDVRFGSIDATGAFEGAAIGGKTKVRARVGAMEAIAEVEVKVAISEDFANLGDDVKTKLRTGGVADANFKWLYPYDHTVFPRGLPSPTLQFAGTAPTAYRVRLKSSRMEVEGFYKGGSGAARIAVAEEWWRAVTFGTDASEAVEVEVTKIQNGAVTGPKKVSWHVAPGSLRGSIFYNSYNSALAIKKTNSSGAVLALKPGKSLDVLLGGVKVGADTNETKCVVCHSVSASGNRLVTGIGWSNTAPDSSNPIYSGSFTLDAAGGATMNRSNTDGRVYAFGALSPDGNWMVSNAVAGGIRGLAGSSPSKLIDVASGAVVSEPFFSGTTTRNAVSPTFSPDGKWIAFNNGGGKELAIASFDASTSPPTIANFKSLYTTTEAKIGWPTFTPDGAAVLAHVGSAFDTEKGNKGDLVVIDVATKKATALDSLNGKSGGSIYLPYGDANDAHMNYEPTLLPVAVGGYYWVVFTSRRALGNTIYDGQYSVNAAGDKPFQEGDAAKKGVRKKLWVAAIDVNRPESTDISHPAFYLEGQELESGNMRGFWALDVCKADGATCEGGDECCNGFCRSVEQSDGSVAAQCVPPPASCANETERCKSDADCCNAPSGTKCINQACTTSAPPTPK